MTWRRAIALWAAAAVIGTVLGLNVHTYSAPGNAGVLIGPEGHNIGYEWRGHPGLFIDSRS